MSMVRIFNRYSFIIYILFLASSSVIPVLANSISKASMHALPKLPKNFSSPPVKLFATILPNLFAPVASGI